MRCLIIIQILSFTLPLSRYTLALNGEIPILETLTRAHEKPELFEISVREQIVKLTGQLIGSYIKYLITE